MIDNTLISLASSRYAFFFYLKAFNSDISVMIQSLGGSIVPNSYELAVQAKNNLIDVGKLPPRPPIFIFLELTRQALEPPYLSTSAPQSMYTYPNAQQASTSTSSTLVAEVSDMKNLLRPFSNEIINLKRQQTLAKPLPKIIRVSDLLTTQTDIRVV